MTCPIPCQSGKWEWKVTCLERKSTWLGQWYSTIFEPCIIEASFSGGSTAVIRNTLTRLLQECFYPGQSLKIINLIETTQTSLTLLRIETHNVMYVDMFPFSCLECAGCGEDIRSGQSLLALEKQWHLWCFTCTMCGCLLSGEYMGRSV